MSGLWGRTSENASTVALDRDPTAEEEKEFFLSGEDREAVRLTNAKLDLENQQFQRDMENREKFADRAFGVTQAWVGFVIVITLAQFSLGKSSSMGLTEKEFMVVVTTTTASIFGFWLLVGRYLFHRSDIPRQRARKNND